MVLECCGCRVHLVCVAEYVKFMSSCVLCAKDIPCKYASRILFAEQHDTDVPMMDLKSPEDKNMKDTRSGNDVISNVVPINDYDLVRKTAMEKKNN